MSAPTDQIDKESPTWRAVKAWADERIKQHQRVLETVGLRAEEYDHARGAIRDLRQLQRLPEQATIFPATASEAG